MKMASFILTLLLGLLSAPVLAQEPNVPGKGNPNGMSDQDYLIQRERILKRMKAASPQQSQQKAAREGEPARDSTYGQGYGSRKDVKDSAESRPTIDGGRPERVERIERVERPEHPHIEHPGRP